MWPLPNSRKHTCWVSIPAHGTARAADCYHQDKSSAFETRPGSACWHLRSCKHYFISKMLVPKATEKFHRGSKAKSRVPDAHFCEVTTLYNRGTWVLHIAAGFSRAYLHAFCASGHPSSLLQTFCLPLSRILGLALHEIIVVWLASCPDKETRR